MGVIWDVPPFLTALHRDEGGHPQGVFVVGYIGTPDSGNAQKAVLIAAGFRV